MSLFVSLVICSMIVYILELVGTYPGLNLKVRVICRQRLKYDLATPPGKRSRLSIYASVSSTAWRVLSIVRKLE
jgi:hypothetical protein